MSRHVNFGARPGEALAAVIATVLDAAEDEAAVTLQEVCHAMEQGLVSDLIDAGRLRPGSDHALAAEIGQLIRRHGPEALVLPLLRGRDGANRPIG